MGVVCVCVFGVWFWEFYFVILLKKSLFIAAYTHKKPPRIRESDSQVQKRHCCSPGAPQDRLDGVDYHCGFSLSVSHASARRGGAVSPIQRSALAQRRLSHNCNRPAEKRIAPLVWLITHQQPQAKRAASFFPSPFPF